jgi:tetratricopeptide (TPR) repeat protein
MGILRIFTGTSGDKSFKRAVDLFNKGKIDETIKLLEKTAAQLEETIKSFEKTAGQAPDPKQAAKADELAEVYALWGRCLAKQKGPSALQLFRRSDVIRPNEGVLREGAILIEELNLASPEATEYVLELGKRTSGDKSFLLNYAKRLVGDGEVKLSDRELELVYETSRSYTLWKGGSTLLADKFMAQGRTDKEAISIYRIALPNRRNNEQLVNIVLEDMIQNNERSEFATNLYKEVLDSGEEDDDSLRLLTEYYVEQQEITPATVGYIEKALDKRLPRIDILEPLAGYLLKSRKEFLDKRRLLLLVFRAGYFNKNVLAFLAQAFAEDGNFTEEALVAYEEALKNNLLTKRITLVLTEHFLTGDRRDDFACHVYEHYLGSWPERKIPRLYSLLSMSYIEKKRIDEQAQVIYEAALVTDSENMDILPLLAASYLTYDTRQPKAYSVYERAYSYIKDAGIKVQVAKLLADRRIEDGNFDRRTLEYIELALPGAKGTELDYFTDARTKCYLTLNRRDDEAFQVYIDLYHRLRSEGKDDAKLTTILSDILIDKPDFAGVGGELRLQILYERFELEKFGCPSGIAFFLLEHALSQNPSYKYLLQLSVRGFEVDSNKLAERLNAHKNLDLLQQIGRFYIERYNFENAVCAFTVANSYKHTEENDYQLAKILLVEGKVEEALELLSQVKSEQMKVRVSYWRAAAQQQNGKPEVAAPLIAELEKSRGPIPEALVKLRKALNAELLGDYGDAIEVYKVVVNDPASLPYRRWIDIETGMALWRMGATGEARKRLEQVFRFNPNGRAEQRHYSYILVIHAAELIENNEWDAALNAVLESVEANRNDRLLRSVAVDLLFNHAKRFFFAKDYEMAVKVLEVAHRILPKSSDTKVYLAYSYHLLKKYAQALIYYRDITWTNEASMLERSQAYCYLHNKQPRNAWRVFLDLKKRGALQANNIPLLLEAYLGDEEQDGSETFKSLEFPEDAKSPIPFAAFYIHDGLYARALNLLAKNVKDSFQEMQRLWFLGKAASKQGDRRLAVTYWKDLLSRSQGRQTHDETKFAQLLEIGMAFLKAGYAQEAMETWEYLKEHNPQFPHLSKLYAFTLDLNAYTLAQKGNIKLAINEWEKATEYDSENLSIIQNMAIAYMSVDDFDRSAVHWRKLMNRWKVMVDRNPQRYAHLTIAIGEVERLLADVFVAQHEQADEVYIAKTEEMVDYYQRANQFYWILGLNRNATKGQIEKAYFRLVKIFNPERHAADFMLLEDAYANLNNERRREKIDTFAYKPIDVNRLRLAVLGDQKLGSVFEQLNLHASIPEPDFSQLQPDDSDPKLILAKLTETIQIYFRLGDLSVV